MKFASAVRVRGLAISRSWARLSIERKSLVVTLLLFGILSAFRAYHFWVTGFIVGDEFGYIYYAIHGQFPWESNAYLQNPLYGDRYFFEFFNIALFRILGIANMTDFAFLLPFYLFFWSSLSIIFLYKILKILSVDDRAIALSLLSLPIVISFLLLSLGFLSEAVGLSLVMIGIYCILSLSRRTPEKSYFIYPFLAALAFAAARYTREPYAIFLLGAIPIVALISSARLKHEGFSKKKKTLLLVVSILCFAGPGLFFAQYPVNIFDQVGPMLGNLVVGRPEIASAHGAIPQNDTPGVNVMMALSLSSRSSLPLAGALQQSAVLDASPAANGTRQSNPSPSNSTTTSTATSTSNSTIPIYHAGEVVRTINGKTTTITGPGPGPNTYETSDGVWIYYSDIVSVVAFTPTTSTTFSTASLPSPSVHGQVLSIATIAFVAGLVLGWEPILFMVSVIGFLILVTKLRRRRDSLLGVILLLAMVSLASDFVATLSFSSNPSFTTFKHYSTLLRLSHTALPAYLLIVPFAFSVLVRNKKYLGTFLAILIIFAVAALPIYQTYASSSFPVRNNPFKLDYRTPGAAIRDYIQSHQGEAPINVIGLDRGMWWITPGAVQLNGSIHIFPSISESDFIAHKWTTFYLAGSWFKSTHSVNGIEAQMNGADLIRAQEPFLYPLLQQNPAANYSASNQFTVVNREFVYNTSADFFLRVQLSWPSS